MPDFFDVHSHYMPKVDDGAASDEMTSQMLQIAYEEGIRQIILTPHYRKPYFTTPREDIDRGYVKVREIAGQVRPEMKIYLGNEVHYHPDLLLWLQEGRVHTMAGTSYVLIEFSMNDTYDLIYNCMRTLIAAQYRPVVAHVERCGALLGHTERVEELVDMGGYIQVNAGTFSGECGFQAKRFVHKLVKQDLVDFVGSDAHNVTDRRPQMLKCAEYLKKIHGREYMERVLKDNPQRMVSNKEL